MDGGRRRQRWVYGIMIGVGALAAGVLILNALIVSRIRSELASLVREQLGGELKGVGVVYRPPYGTVLRNVRVVTRDPAGGERDLLRADRVDLRLEKRPR